MTRPTRAARTATALFAFAALVAIAAPDAFAMSGKEIAESKGCLNCHSEDGTRKVGPTFQGIFGREVTVKRGDETLTLEADADYLRRAIEEPAAEIVEGYSPAMPVYNFPEKEMNALLEYLKGL